MYCRVSLVLEIAFAWLATFWRYRPSHIYILHLTRLINRKFESFWLFTKLIINSGFVDPGTVRKQEIARTRADRFRRSKGGKISRILTITNYRVENIDNGTPQFPMHISSGSNVDIPKGCVLGGHWIWVPSGSDRMMRIRIRLTIFRDEM